MLDTPGKMLERFIFNRIEAAAGHLLADNQYGFRKGKSKLDAINQVAGKVKESISGKRGNTAYLQLSMLKIPLIQLDGNGMRLVDLKLAEYKTGTVLFTSRNK